MNRPECKPRAWAEEEIEIVKAGAARGESANTIARQLRGRTRNAVLGVMFRNGWTKKGRAETRTTFNRAAPVVRAMAAYQRATQGPESITLAGPAWSHVRVAA